MLSAGTTTTSNLEDFPKYRYTYNKQGVLRAALHRWMRKESWKTRPIKHRGDKSFRRNRSYRRRKGAKAMRIFSNRTREFPEEERAAFSKHAVFCYTPAFALCVIAKPENSFVRFHANQGARFLITIFTLYAFSYGLSKAVGQEVYYFARYIIFFYQLLLAAMAIAATMKKAIQFHWLIPWRIMLSPKKQTQNLPLPRSPQQQAAKKRTDFFLFKSLTDAFSQEDRAVNRDHLLFCYTPACFIVPFVYWKNPYVRFHTDQGLGLMLCLATELFLYANCKIPLVAQLAQNLFNVHLLCGLLLCGTVLCGKAVRCYLVPYIRFFTRK